MLNNKRQNQIITISILIILILLYAATWAIHSIISRDKIRDTVIADIQNKDGEVQGEETEKNPDNEGNNNVNNGNEGQKGEENQEPGPIIDYKDRIRVMEDGKTDWKGIKELNIFKNYYFGYKPIIAPGVNGSYNFTVENTNKGDCIYNIQLDEENEYKINMVYKIKLNEKYICGTEENWLGIKDLKVVDSLLKENSTDIYTLEWKWQDSDNDTEIGKNIESKYKLNVIVNAVEKEGM